MRIQDRMYKLEKRFIIASFIAGSCEIVLRFISGSGFFGYLGVGMVLYAIAHYTLLRLSI